ncbi:MAG: FtsX-like permease family protein [Pseudohongiella sp.]|uniref:ABC transporter permease n=1 Tax=Pseudohongiella sp. TaxID=1979412 RepID=UPI0034A023D6
MFLNYLTVLARSILKHPTLTIAKVLSLILGLTCASLVVMHARYAFTHDQHFPNSENIYRLVTSLTNTDRLDFPWAADPYGPQLALDYPQIEHIAKLMPASGIYSTGDLISENAHYVVEPEILEIFSLDFIAGNASTALLEPNTVVLNETASHKYFGSSDSVGQTLTLNNELDLRVSAVIRDLPENTHLDFPILISVDTARQLFGDDYMNSPAWLGFTSRTYLSLPNTAEAQAISDDLDNFVVRNIPEQLRNLIEQNDLTLSLEPLHDIYLSPREGVFGGGIGREGILYGLLVFAGVALLSSCINYVNLSISQAQARAKEIGTRKIFGASRSQLATQLLIESVGLALLAILISIPVIALATPVYTNITNTQFSFYSLFQGSTALWILALVVFTGVFSGLVPAILLSRLPPATTLGAFGVKGPINFTFLSFVSGIQFTLAITLIIVAVCISRQILFLTGYESGFEKSNLLVMDTGADNADLNYQAMLDELNSHPSVMSLATSSSTPPSPGSYNDGWRKEGEANGDSPASTSYVISPEYVDTYQFELLAGRGFSPDYVSDFVSVLEQGPESGRVYGVIITSEVLRTYGYTSADEAIGDYFYYGDFHHRVIGVVDSFRFSGGLEDSTRTTKYLRGSLEPMRYLSVRIDPTDTEGVLSHIDSVWSKYLPGVPVNRTFYEQTFNNLIQEEIGAMNLASMVAASLTSAIAILGLYAGIANFIQSNLKEIGIRRVLGATYPQIFRMVSQRFSLPVIIACLISIAAGFFITTYYLSLFSSRPSSLTDVFVSVPFGAATLTLLLIGLFCLRATAMAPNKLIRYE